MRKFVKVVTRIRKRLCHPISDHGDFLFRFSSPMLVSASQPIRARTSHLAVNLPMFWTGYQMIYSAASSYGIR